MQGSEGYYLLITHLIVRFQEVLEPVSIAQVQRRNTRKREEKKMRLAEKRRCQVKSIYRGFSEMKVSASLNQCADRGVLMTVLSIFR